MAMEAREQIFSDIREALGSLPERTPYPEYEVADFIRQNADDAGPLAKQFQVEFEKVHGTVCDSAEALKGVLARESVQRLCCDPELKPLFEGLGLPIDTSFDRKNPDRCDAGVTRGSGVIAESGTLILKDADTFDRLAALAPWVHIAVVSRRSIYPTIPDAIADLGDDPNVIWCTGPSKTADVEGILIEGVHGPGIQIVYWVD
jgi:L-lactate dehydrogenase complex protein LldG